jgi:hypothetical protein
MADNFLNALIPIPASDSDAVAKLKQVNTITVMSGAVLLGGGDIYLNTDRYGTADLFAQLRNAYYGGDLATSNWYFGTSSTSAVATVTVDGTVRTGFMRNKTLVLDSWTDGSLVPATAPTVSASTQSGITYSVSTELAATSLFQQIATAQANLNVFGPDRARSSNPSLFDFWTGEIKRISDILVSQGLATRPAGSPPGTLVPVQRYAITVTLNPIASALGNIYVRAGDSSFAIPDTTRAGGLLGSGTLDTPHDLAISITNKTPANLIIQNITVAPSLGEVYYNGNKITSSGALNFVGTGQPGDVTVQVRDIAPPPRQGSVYPDPTITVTGTVTVPGTWRVHGDAGYNVSYAVTSTGSVTANTVDINVNGSVLINAPSDVIVSVGGDIMALWNSYTNGGTTAPSQWALDQLQGILSTPATTPSILANSITIVAGTINVNGLIQSGKASYDLTLSDALNAEIANLKASGATGLVRLQGVVSDDFRVFYDTARDRLVVSQLQVRAGSITLDGRIISTGRGNIKALGGYASINVTNNTAYDVEITALDNSQRGQGTIRINDNTKGWAKVALVTDYGEGSYWAHVDWTGYITAPGGTSEMKIYDASGNYKETAIIDAADIYGIKFHISSANPVTPQANWYFSNRVITSVYSEQADAWRIRGEGRAGEWGVGAAHQGADVRGPRRQLRGPMLALSRRGMDVRGALCSMADRSAPERPGVRALGGTRRLSAAFRAPRAQREWRCPRPPYTCQTH